jgi:DNA-binding beta-propeller fold protein YncE
MKRTTTGGFIIVAGVMCMLTLALAGCMTSDSSSPMLSDSPVSVIEDEGFTLGERPGLPGTRCEAGQVAACYSSEPLTDDGGEAYCLEGVMDCVDGTWGECDFASATRMPIIGDPQLCGGCDPACFRQHTCPTGRDLTDQNSSNVRFDLDRNGLVLGGKQISARFAYIANSSEDTVSKIDLGTATEVGRYVVGSSPSRTAVDSRGNCYVAMRGEHWETVAKIAGDRSYCVDRNLNGRIDTSTGAGVLSRGTDECVLWWSRDAVGACPRGVAIDAQGRVWVGGWCITQFYVLDPNTGRLIRSVPISASCYGAAIDSAGMLWYSGRSHAWIQNVNTETFAVGPARGTGCGGDLYGIAIDRSNRVWIVCAHEASRVSRYNPASNSWIALGAWAIPHPRTARGVTVDGGGDVWLGTHHDWGWNFGQGYGYEINSETAAVRREYLITGCDGAIGVSSDFENNMWFACHGSWTGSRLNPDTGAVTNVRVGAYPYTYSDFTGFLRATITSPEGSYQQLFDSQLVCARGSNVVWSQLYYDVETPASTRINFYARTAALTTQLGTARELLVAQAPGDRPPADVQGTMAAMGVPNGLRYFEVRVHLQSLDGSTSPVFRNMDLVYYCVVDPCTNGVRDGRETDVDCGGALCSGCAAGRSCVAGTDCSSGTCTGGTCQPCSRGSCAGAGQYCLGGACRVARSCLDLRTSDAGLTSGMYTITPTGSTVGAMDVYCDMVSDGGGYTMMKVDNGGETNAAQAETYCRARGMHLFVPRTEAHRAAALNFIRSGTGGPATHMYMYILGVYPRAVGAGCCGVRMRSDYCGNWRAWDDGRYYIANHTHICEPNGDNGTDSSMYYDWTCGGYEPCWYNDINPPGYTSRYFMCDVADKR